MTINLGLLRKWCVGRPGIGPWIGGGRGIFPLYTFHWADWGGYHVFDILPPIDSPTNEASSTLHCSLGSLGGVSMFLIFSPQLILPSIMLAGPDGPV